eukprot:10609496-Alexandrium_andersonii.AAC.1
MSASLVGSEMCIRDRLLGGPWPGPRRLLHRLLVPRAYDKLGCAALGLGCLLYTSDAADDM